MKSFPVAALLATLLSAPLRAQVVADAGAAPPTFELPPTDAPVVLAEPGADGGPAAVAPPVVEGRLDAPVVALIADAGLPIAQAVADAGEPVAPTGVVTVGPTEGPLPSLDSLLANPGKVEEVLVAPEDEADPDDTTDDGEVADESGEADPEGESHAETGPQPLNDHYYTSDLSDSELLKVWQKNRAILGPISVGFTDAGRLLNGEKFPSTGGPWTIVVPENAYGTHETVEFLETAFTAVDAQLPGGPPGRLNHISGKDGGYLRPHHSHQSGRDADIGFYYKSMPGPRAWDRSRYMDLPRNWAFIRSIVTMTDVQFVLVDKRIQAVLIKYALSIGEDRDWVKSLFQSGSNALVKHARHHRDHFHVRFFNARAQELGRRVQPLLAKSKDERSTIAHRIRAGDSLGRIAMKYGTTITALKKTNGLRSTMIRAGHVLVIPVRGACVNCPVPPPVVVPPRRMPPLQQVSAIAGTPAG